MRVYSATIALVASLSPQIPFSSGFVPSRVVDTPPTRVNNIQRQLQHYNTKDPRRSRLRRVLCSTSTEENETTSAASASTIKKKKKKLGLITFDLDDTLYPIAPVLDEANAAFSAAMSNFGYVDIEPSDIVETGKEIRAQVSPDNSNNGGVDDGSGSAAQAADPLRPTTVNHKEIRMAAIRKEMEQFILRTKLEQTAEDWATEVESLTAPVRKSAEKWARTTVHSSVVQAVYNAWEMERHHAAERHLFPEAITAIKQIQSDHKNVIIGAVTDGSANPMLMVFSLMPLFDFTVSWEDDLDMVQQMEQFQELGSVDKSDGLSWIYRLAVERGKEMSMLTDEIKKKDDGEEDADEEIEWCWVHVGDDLAYDVGGSATTGAKTVLVELAPEYGQTARLRTEGKMPSWTTETEELLKNHREMSINALDKVDAKITHLSQLPEVINELMNGEDDK
mmetsp:Transcript_7283/g.18102  ORF Transcript_7283/g.18102 Transcript_7283/m.18102 type:complete len:449 (-) Transcript_7283:1175-2521(-)